MSDARLAEAGTLDALAALADLRGAGHDLSAALGALVRVGGAPGQFAERVLSQVAAGASLGTVLWRLKLLTGTELAALGGPNALDEAPGLRALARRRLRRAARRRTLLAALGLPLALAVLTAGSLRATVALVGSLVAPGQAGSGWGTAGGLLSDLVPFALLAAAVVALTGRRARLSAVAGLGQLPVLGRLGARAAVADAAEWLADAAQAHLPPARGFAGAATLHAGGLALGLSGTARRLEEGAPLAECLPPAARVGSRLALALAAGVGTGDLAARLAGLAAEERAALERAVRRVVRVCGWLALIWVSGRSLSGLTGLASAAGGGLPGLQGLPGLELPGTGAPAGGPAGGELEQLMREIE